MNASCLSPGKMADDGQMTRSVTDKTATLPLAFGIWQGGKDNPSQAMPLGACWLGMTADPHSGGKLARSPFWQVFFCVFLCALCDSVVNLLFYCGVESDAQNKQTAQKSAQRGNFVEKNRGEGRAVDDFQTGDHARGSRRHAAHSGDEQRVRHGRA